MARRTRFEEPLSPKRDATFPGRAVEKFDPKALPANFFYVSISGVIESGEISNEVYLQSKFEIVTGSDWEIVTVIIFFSSSFIFFMKIFLLL